MSCRLGQAKQHVFILFTLSAAVAWTQFVFMEEIRPHSVRTGPFRSLLPLSPFAGEEGSRDWEEPVLRVICTGVIGTGQEHLPRSGVPGAASPATPPFCLAHDREQPLPKSQVRRPLRMDFQVLGTSVLHQCSRKKELDLELHYFSRMWKAWMDHQWRGLPTNHTDDSPVSVFHRQMLGDLHICMQSSLCFTEILSLLLETMFTSTSIFKSRQSSNS